jgi:hypothetical protein
VKCLRAACAVVLAASPALAQDEPAKKPDPAPASPPAAQAQPEAKKERKSTPESDAALARYESLLAFPPKDVQKLRFKIESDVPGQGLFKVDFRWEKGKPSSAEVELPENLVQMIPPQMLSNVKDQVTKQFAGSVMDSPVSKFADYNLASKSDAGKVTVELTPAKASSQFDKGTLYFDADGLLAKSVVTMRADPSNPQSAMLAGAEITTTYKYTKAADRYVVESSAQSTPMGEVSVTFAYFDLKDQPKLLKSLEVASPQMPITIEYHDYEVDGKPVAGTQKKAEPKKEPAEKPAEKPTEPAPAPAPKDAK